MPVMEITDEQLVGRAMASLMPRTAGTSPRWVAVMETFGLGSTYAHMLCLAHDLDPDEMLTGPICEVCEAENEEDEHEAENQHKRDECLGRYGA